MSGPPIRSVADIRREQDEADKDRDQRYFTGGKSSGMQVVVPGQDNAPSGADFVRALFERVQQTGAETASPPAAVPAAAADAPAAGASGPWSSGGFRLGTSLTPAIAETSAAVAAAADGARGGSAGPPIVVCIYFWRTGFSVDDGPLRLFADPKNKEFLDELRSGVPPSELRNELSAKVPKGQEIHFNLVDRSQLDYERPKPKFVPFSGTGQSLGSSAGTTPAASAAAAEAPRPQTVVIDDSKPVTSLQIRLHDGTRVVGRFNHTHTVADLQSFVASCARTTQGQSFLLQTTFPVTTLSDSSKTLAEAGLVNAVVVQKLV